MKEDILRKRLLPILYQAGAAALFLALILVSLSLGFGFAALPAVVFGAFLWLSWASNTRRRGTAASGDGRHAD